MCFGGPRQPEPPINRPTYAPTEAHRYFDISMTDEDTGKVIDLDGRTTKQNQRATQGLK